MAEADDDREVEAAIDLAMSEGAIWLNDVFKFHDSSRRLFRTRGPRISRLELFWAIACGLVVLGITAGMYSLVGAPGPLQIVWGIPGMIIWTGFALWKGRAVAHMSPLRRRTGEGTGIWIWMMFKRAVVRVSFLIQRPVMYNNCVSRVAVRSGEPTVIECVEWIGTARAPRMPYISDPLGINKSRDYGYVYTPARGRRVVHKDRPKNGDLFR